MKLFTIAEFNSLVNRMISGVPVDLAINRLQLALAAVLDEAGQQGANALRKFVAALEGTAGKGSQP
jgi:hypothetical protein